MSHQWMILAVAPCMLVGAAPAGAATPFSKQVSAGPEGTVQISNVSGDITITAWDKSAVDVQGDLAPGVERVDVVQEGGDVRIKVVLKERDWRNRDHWGESEARLQIKVPLHAELDASTVSGSVAVSGARGDQRLRSVSGDIRSDVAGAEVTGTTVSGSVELSGSGKEKQVRATSVSGDVRLRHMGGEIEARSTSGSIELETSNASEVHAGAVSGNIVVQGSLTRDAEVDVSAVSGRVSVSAQAPAGFRYDATTFSGNIKTCFGSDAQSRRLSGERGEGKASIRARSHSGRVELCDR